MKALTIILTIIVICLFATGCSSIDSKYTEQTALAIRESTWQIIITIWIMWIFNSVGGKK